MAMTKQQAPTAMGPATLCYLRCLFFLFITVVTMNSNTPALAGDSSPPSTLVVYVHRKNLPPNATIVEVASPSGKPAIPEFPGEFGTTFVVEDIVRETEAPDSPIIGSNDGLVVTQKDDYLYVSVTFVLNINGFSGTISFQGVTRLTEELAITGGTKDFRFARGYGVPTFVVLSPEVTVFRVDFTIRYD